MISNREREKKQKQEYEKNKGLKNIIIFHVIRNLNLNLLLVRLVSILNFIKYVYFVVGIYKKLHDRKNCHVILFIRHTEEQEEENEETKKNIKFIIYKLKMMNKIAKKNSQEMLQLCFVLIQNTCKMKLEKKIPCQF